MFMTVKGYGSSRTPDGKCCSVIQQLIEVDESRIGLLTGGIVVDAVEFGEAGESGEGAWRGWWPAQNLVPHPFTQG